MYDSLGYLQYWVDSSPQLKLMAEGRSEPASVGTAFDTIPQGRDWVLDMLNNVQPREQGVIQRAAGQAPGLMTFSQAFDGNIRGLDLLAEEQIRGGVRLDVPPDRDDNF
jgi:hypothetical protein